MRKKEDMFCLFPLATFVWGVLCFVTFKSLRYAAHRALHVFVFPSLLVNKRYPVLHANSQFFLVLLRAYAFSGRFSQGAHGRFLLTVLHRLLVLYCPILQRIQGSHCALPFTFFA